LDIKKILHEEHPHENLDVDLSVADVFVQHGRAYTDGEDQRAIAVVAQNPLTHPSFTREDSVVQDWSSAATAARSFSTAGESHSFQRPAPTIPTIQEDEPSLSHTSPRINNEHIEIESIQNGSNNSGPKSPSYDIPMQSVEREPPGDDNEVLKSLTWQRSSNYDDREIVESSPQLPREASEELGGPDPPRASHTSHLEQIDEERSLKPSSRGRSGSSASSGNLERQQFIVRDSQTVPPLQKVPGSPREQSHQPEDHELPGQQGDLAVKRQKSIVKDSQTASILQELPGSREKSPQLESHELPHQQAEKMPVKEPEEFERDQNGDIDMLDPDDVPEPVPEPQYSATRVSRTFSTDIPSSFKDKLLQDTATKRKRQSPDQLPPSKEPRLELSTEPSTPLSRKNQHLQPSDAETHDRLLSSTPSQPRVRRLSFSSPQRGSLFAVRPAYVPEGSLGFGITASPRRNRKLPVIGVASTSTAPKTPVPAVEIKLSSSQLSNMTPSRSGKNLTDSGTKLRSALRKDGLSDRNRVRRSISFVDDEPNGNLPAKTAAPKTSSKLAQSPENGDSSAEKRHSISPEPRPAQSHGKGTPSSIGSEGKRRSVPPELKPAQPQLEGTPSSVNSDEKRRSASTTPKIVWPSNVSQETINKYKKEAGLKINSAKNKKKATANTQHTENNHADELAEKQATPRKRSNASESSTKSATPDANNDSVKNHAGSEQPSGEKSKKSTAKRKSHILSDFERVGEFNTGSNDNHEPQLSPSRSTGAQSPVAEDNNLPPAEKKIRDEISTLRVDKISSTQDKVTPNDVSSKKKAATRTISQMNMEEISGDGHHHSGSVQRARTPVELADFNSSQSSMAMKQLHSELELAHNESPAKHGYSPAPQIQQTAEKAPESSSGFSDSDSDSDSDSSDSSDSDSDSESGSESQSLIEPIREPEAEETQPAPAKLSAVVKLDPNSGPDSDSDSDSDLSLNLDSSSDSDSDDDDSDDDLFKHTKTEKQPKTLGKSQDNILSQHTFGSNSSWTPVNMNKRHTFSSVRADMRREQEASKAAAAMAKPAANDTKRIRKDIFEFPSSSDSDDIDADDSDNDDRGDILPTGKENIMSKSKVKMPFSNGFGSH
jgi:hypothetical protein